MDAPKFNMPVNDLALELTHHVNVVGSVLKTDGLYRMDELEEHYSV